MLLRVCVDEHSSNDGHHLPRLARECGRREEPRKQPRRHGSHGYRYCRRHHGQHRIKSKRSALAVDAIAAQVLHFAKTIVSLGQPPPLQCPSLRSPGRPRSTTSTWCCPMLPPSSPLKRLHNTLTTAHGARSAILATAAAATAQLQPIAATATRPRRHGGPLFDPTVRKTGRLTPPLMQPMPPMPPLPW